MFIYLLTEVIAVAFVKLSNDEMLFCESFKVMIENTFKTNNTYRLTKVVEESSFLSQTHPPHHSFLPLSCSLWHPSPACSACDADLF